MQGERVRERQRHVEIDPWYEDLLKRDRRNIERLETGEVVVRAGDVPWHQNRHARVKYLLHPMRPETAVSDTMIFVHEITKHSGMHRHQGGLALFVLDGRGHTVVNGEAHDWEAGDLILLPIAAGGLDHQHFNDGGSTASWLALIFWPWLDLLSNQMVQVEVSPQWLERQAEADGETLADGPLAKPRGEIRMPEGLPRPHDGTYLDRLFARRDAYRAQAAAAEWMLHGRDLPWEINLQGKMRWYLHPDKTDASIRTLLVYLQEIPPGSRSGRQLHPGGLIHYVLRGEGYTMLDGQRHDWRAGDCVALPRRVFGVDYQHFNADPRRPAQLLCMCPNLFEVFGPDLGARFEQLEAAPEYGAADR
ncbi:MAG TPA: cupin domain-containing protein [Chloroflexota bacterium]|jgi:gentisate 1,2-dioxygenase